MQWIRNFDKPIWRIDQIIDPKEQEQQKQKQITYKLNMIFFISQTNFIQYRNSNIAVCFSFFFCSLLNLLTNSLAAELAYPLNGNIWRINICAQLTSIWQITSFCTVLFMFQLDVIFFCYSWLASVRCVRRPIIYYVWLVNRGEKHLRQRYSNTFLAYQKKNFVRITTASNQTTLFHLFTSSLSSSKISLFGWFIYFFGLS